MAEEAFADRVLLYGSQELPAGGGPRSLPTHWEGRALHVEPHHTADQSAGLIRAEPRAKVAQRLSAVRLALLGHTAAEVGERVLMSERAVRGWVGRYNAGGAGALADRPGRGRRGPLTPAAERRLADRLRAGPTAADGVCALRGEDVRRIPAAEFGVVRSLQANRTLVTLPPYAPELNPVEWLWLDLRQHHGSNRVYPTLADLEEAAVGGWRAVYLNAERIKTVCRCDYLEPGK